jgi:hypothetical protein
VDFAAGSAYSLDPDPVDLAMETTFKPDSRKSTVAKGSSAAPKEKTSKPPGGIREST